MASDTDDAGALPRPIRTVTPPFRGRRDTEMGYVGWLIFAGLIVLLIPLGPFVFVLWLLSKVVGRGPRE